MKMAGVFRKRALYTNAEQAKHTFVSLDGVLEKRQTREKGKETSLIFEGISASGFLHKCGIRNGDRLTSVNFFPAKDVPFDLLIDAIRGLTPLALTVERTSHDGAVVTIVVVMEIRADRNDEPYLKFHGLYFWKDCETLETDTIIKYIPVDVEPLTTYRYDSSVSNVTIIGHQDNNNYWLTVDESDIEFRKQDSSKAVFTMYLYNSNSVQTGTPVIMVPQDNPSQCLAATKSNELTLVSFDAATWTGSENYPEDERFLLMVEEASNMYKIESSMVTGQYIAKGPDDEAIMSTEFIPVTANEGGKEMSLKPSQSPEQA